MRAVWYDRQGAAEDVLTCGELPTPEAGHGEVRVRLEASGVNPSCKWRGCMTGRWRLFPELLTGRSVRWSALGCRPRRSVSGP